MVDFSFSRGRGGGLGEEAIYLKVDSGEIRGSYSARASEQT